jgi:thiamine monophosphate kinase
MKRISLAVLAGAALLAVPVQAHHSFAATYKENLKVTIEGDIVQFMFRNPHSFVTVLAKDETGEMQRWAVEWGAGGQLGRQGVTRETLKPGDHVIITGDPSRTPGDRRLRMRNIVRPSDGWKWGGEFD